MSEHMKMFKMPIATDFLDNYKILLYTEVEGEQYKTRVVRAEKVYQYLEEWSKTGTITLPASGVSEWIGAVDIIKPISLTVMAPELQYHMVERPLSYEEGKEPETPCILDVYKQVQEALQRSYDQHK